MQRNYRLSLGCVCAVITLTALLSTGTAARIDDVDQTINLPIFSVASQITDAADLIDDNIFNTCQKFVAKSPRSPNYGNFLTDCLTSSAISGASRNYVLTRRMIYDLLNSRFDDALRDGSEACSGKNPIRRIDFVIVLRRFAWISQRQNDRIDAIKYYKLAKDWTKVADVSVQCDLEIAAQVGS